MDGDGEKSEKIFQLQRLNVQRLAKKKKKK